jgi:hypothetical protein
MTMDDKDKPTAGAMRATGTKTAPEWIEYLKSRRHYAIETGDGWIDCVEAQPLLDLLTAIITRETARDAQEIVEALETIAECVCTNTGGPCAPPVTCPTCIARAALAQHLAQETP